MANYHKNHRKTRRRYLFSGIAVVGVALVAVIASSLGSNHTIDPAKLAQAELGDIARSVVATGKIEPLATTRSRQCRLHH